MAVPFNHRAVEEKWRKHWEEHPVNVNDGKKLHPGKGRLFSGYAHHIAVLYLCLRLRSPFPVYGNYAASQQFFYFAPGSVSRFAEIFVQTHATTSIRDNIYS